MALVDGNKSQSQPRKRIIVAITGASGAIYGIRAIEMLKHENVEIHLILSEPSQITIKQETSRKVEEVIALSDFNYDPEDFFDPIASGSTTADGMLVIPCSIKTLSGIANSYNENLIIRSADVTLKEGKPLILVVRETPLHRGHLRLMDMAAQAGAIIFPPVPAFYGNPKTINDIVDTTVGRVLRRLGFENPYYDQWNT